MQINLLWAFRLSFNGVSVGLKANSLPLIKWIFIVMFGDKPSCLWRRVKRFEKSWLTPQSQLNIFLYKAKVFTEICMELAIDEGFK